MSFAFSNIKFSDIQSNLGGDYPIFLSEYYANNTPGYGYGVVASNIGTQISVQQFQSQAIPTLITMNNTGGTLVDHVITFTLNYKSSYSNNFQDLRFVEERSNIVLPHWFETVIDNSSAKVWLRVPYFTNGNRIKITTKNTPTTGVASNVFPLYDDFSGGIDTTNTWTISGDSYTVATSNLSFTSTTFTYLVSKSNYPANFVIETGASSSSTGSVMEFILRGNVSTNTGIKARVDSRLANNGTVGTYINNPFNSWAVLYRPNTVSFPSNGTSQKLTFVASSSNFSFSSNDFQVSTYTNNAIAFNNSSGVVGVANHNGAPVSFRYIRGYPSTSNTISVTIV